MVAPLVVYGAIAAGTALAGWLNSQAGQKASEEERKRVTALIQKLRSPKFDPTNIRPEEYRIVARYAPQVSDFIAEVAPTLVQGGEDTKLEKETVREAIAKLRAESQDDTAGKLAVQEAIDQAAAQARAQDATIAQDFAMRGQGGSGVEAMSRLMGAQRGAGVMADVTRRAKLDSLRMGIEDLRNAAGLASQLGASERALSEANAGIINQFNSRTADARRTWAYQKDQTLNDALRRNADLENDVAFRNTDLRNQSALRAQERADMMERERYGADLDKAKLLSGVSDQARADIRDRTKSNQEAIGGLGDMGMTIAGRSFAGGGSGAPANTPRTASLSEEGTGYQYPAYPPRQSPYEEDPRYPRSRSGLYRN